VSGLYQCELYTHAPKQILWTERLLQEVGSRGAACKASDHHTIARLQPYHWHVAPYSDIGKALRGDMIIHAFGEHIGHEKIEGAGPQELDSTGGIVGECHLQAGLSSELPAEQAPFSTIVDDGENPPSFDRGMRVSAHVL